MGIGLPQDYRMLLGGLLKYCFMGFTGVISQRQRRRAGIPETGALILEHCILVGSGSRPEVTISGCLHQQSQAGDPIWPIKVSSVSCYAQFLSPACRPPQLWRSSQIADWMGKQAACPPNQDTWSKEVASYGAHSTARRGRSKLAVPPHC